LIFVDLIEITLLIYKIQLMLLSNSTYIIRLACKGHHHIKHFSQKLWKASQFSPFFCLSSSFFQINISHLVLKLCAHLFSKKIIRSGDLYRGYLFLHLKLCYSVFLKWIWFEKTLNLYFFYCFLMILTYLMLKIKTNLIFFYFNIFLREKYFWKTNVIRPLQAL